MFRIFSYGRKYMSSIGMEQQQLIRSQLTDLFSKENRHVLTRKFQILPKYFSRRFVDSFCSSPRIDEYHKYVQTKILFKAEKLKIKKYFKDQGGLKINHVKIKYLEVYLHWLFNECQLFNLHQNDYIMENINMERPEQWFLGGLKKQPRVFIYHHGPTNSGKSSTAIQDLKTLSRDAKGIYMAPLRLLAWEFQQKLGNCTLITGQQKQYKNSNLISCTIQAAPLQDEYEVAVIDQIQMIGDASRGWAWTKAILATKAKRIHLCGDERALGIVSKLLEMTGDLLEERRYSRLSKLTLLHKQFRLEKIEPGDCIINFSMKKLLRHRNEINKMVYNRQKAKESQNEQISSFPNNTAIVYGRLPPECRKQQAKQFNQNKLPYLVATNAIGMGLNFNIRRIIFMSIERSTHDGLSEELEEHQIQQIAGRAGRGEETGFVQCANSHILNRVKNALKNVNKTYGIQLEVQNDQANQEDQLLVLGKDKQKKNYNILLNRQMTEKQNQIKKACMYFTPKYLQQFKAIYDKLNGRPLSMLEILAFLQKYGLLGKSYFLQNTEQKMKYLFRILENNKFDIEDLLIFYQALCMVKFNNVKDKKVQKRIQKTHKTYIKDFINKRKVEIPLFLVQDYDNNYEDYTYIEQIEELQYYYSLLEIYVWLWNKYEFVFYQIKLALNIKDKLSNKIHQILVNNISIKNVSKRVEKLDEQSQYPSFEQAKVVQSSKESKEKKKHIEKIREKNKNKMFKSKRQGQAKQ